MYAIHFDPGTGAEAVVLRVLRAANRAAAENPWHSGRGSAAENGDPVLGHEPSLA